VQVGAIFHFLRRVTSNWHELAATLSCMRCLKLPLAQEKEQDKRRSRQLSERIPQCLRHGAQHWQRFLKRIRE
jgi:hypothetical protein